MNDVAEEIISRNMRKNTEGMVLRNTRGAEWTKYAVCNRFHRLQEITGKKLTSYALRHGFATRKLKEKKGHIALANVMGHVDGSMLAKVYQHVDDDEDFLREVLD